MVNYWELLTAWNQLKTFQYKKIEEIKRYQLKRFKQLIQHAYERILMYREFYDAHNFDPASIDTYEDIENVPPITKDIIRDFPLEKRIDPQFSAKDVHKDRTSGSTGQPTEIWTSQTASLIESLKGIRFLREWGYSPLDTMVKLWRADVEVTTTILQKLGLFRRQLISILDEPHTVVEKLQRSQCDVLMAIRSSLEVFGEELNKQGKKLSPRILVSCGEVLNEEHRQFFKKTYGCYPLEIYGAVETGNIAWECPANPQNLHIEMETVLVNFHNVQLMDNGNQVGSIVVTNLNNDVMPFICHELGDLIILPENSQCSCGRTLPLLGKVLGRRNDDIVEYRGRKFNFQFFYNFLKNYLYIQRYKVVQTKDGDIEFRVQLFEDTEENRKRCVSDLTSAFNSYFSPLNVKFVDGFSMPPNGKFKVIEKI